MSVDAQQLRKVCVYEAQLPLASVLADVQEMDKTEQGFGRYRKARVWNGVACVGAGILGIVLAAAFDLVGPGVLLTLLGFFGGIGLFIYAYSYGRMLTTYRWRLELLRDLGKALEQDSDPKTPVKVALGLKDRGRLLKEEIWPARKRGKQRFSEDDWLSIEGRFLDGTMYSETIRELVRKRTYVNPRGKSKTKFRSWHFISIRLACPKEHYGDLQPLEEGLRKTLRLPESAVVRGLKVGAKAVTLRVRVDLRNELLQANLMMYLGLYRALNLARQAQGQSK